MFSSEFLLDSTSTWAKSGLRFADVSVANLYQTQNTIEAETLTTIETKLIPR